MIPASTAQIRAIHTLKGRIGLDEDAYRDLIEREAGTRTSKGLSIAQAVRVIDRLKVLSGEARGAPEGTRRVAGALRLEGPYAGICRALWISAFNLGVVEHREDTALVAFVRRQANVDHLNWVRDWNDARAIVEALKGWLTREAGVVWPGRKEDSPAARKRAVIAAQLRIVETAAPDAVVPLRVASGLAPEAELDAIMGELGVLVRRAKER